MAYAGARLIRSAVRRPNLRNRLLRDSSRIAMSSGVSSDFARSARTSALNPTCVLARWKPLSLLIPALDAPSSLVLLYARSNISCPPQPSRKPLLSQWLSQFCVSLLLSRAETRFDELGNVRRSIANRSASTAVAKLQRMKKPGFRPAKNGERRNAESACNVSSRQEGDRCR